MPSTAPSTLAPTDAELVGRIAQRQDREAFALLYRRYERPAHGLLMHIVRDTTRAEDALQEAFLNVWRHAGTLRDETNVRGWVLRIVAHEGLRTIRQRRRLARQVELDRAGQVEASDAPVAVEARGDAELSEALRREIAGLDAEARSLIALYFGGGLSQREIGEALDLTQQAISKKMGDALARLRRGLAQAGFAAAVPVLEQGTLAEALCQGQAPGMEARILARLDAASKASRRVVAAKSGGVALYAGAAALLFAAGIGWWVLRTPAQTAAQSGLKAPSVSDEPPDVKRTWRWDFEHPTAPDKIENLRVVQGTWSYRPGGGLENSGCLACDSDFTVLVLDVPADRLPVVVTVRRKVVAGSDRYNATLAWTHQEYVGNFDGIGRAARAEYSQWDLTNFWVADGWIKADCSITQGDGFMVAKPQPGAKLAVMLEGKCLVDGLSVEEVDPKRLPDSGKYLKALVSIPADKRVGSVPLPELEPVDAKRPVQVTFYPKGTPFKNLKTAEAADGITEHGDTGREAAPAPARP